MAEGTETIVILRTAVASPRRFENMPGGFTVTSALMIGQDQTAQNKWNAAQGLASVKRLG
jgi:hypothetical protein